MVDRHFKGNIRLAVYEFVPALGVDIRKRRIQLLHYGDKFLFRSLNLPGDCRRRFARKSHQEKRHIERSRDTALGPERTEQNQSGNKNNDNDDEVDYE